VTEEPENAIIKESVIDVWIDGLTPCLIDRKTGQSLKVFWRDRMIDKNSKEWKDYSERLLAFDELAGPFFAIPHSDVDISFDMAGYFRALTENYHGDSDLMPAEEKERFIKRHEQHRKTA